MRNPLILRGTQPPTGVSCLLQTLLPLGMINLAATFPTIQGYYDAPVNQHTSQQIKKSLEKECVN